MTKQELIKKYEQSIEHHKEEIDSLITRLNKDKQVDVSIIASLIVSHNNNIMQEELFLYHLEQLEFDSKSSKLQEENAELKAKIEQLTEILMK
jgi:thymidine phosphorylase